MYKILTFKFETLILYQKNHNLIFYLFCDKLRVDLLFDVIFKKNSNKTAKNKSQFGVAVYLLTTSIIYSPIFTSKIDLFFQKRRSFLSRT